MPLINSDDARKVVADPVLTLTYGKPKTRKSTWYFESASKHHNVIYLDFDNASALKAKVPPENGERFFYIPMYKRPLAATNFLSALIMHPHKALWDCENHALVDPSNMMLDPETQVTEVNLANADHSTRLVIDGWSTLTQAVYEYFGTNIAKSKNVWDMTADRGDYKPMFTMLSGLLLRLKALGVSVDVITWEETHIVHDPRTVGGDNKAKDARILEMFAQPVSVSHSHAVVFAGYFTQVLRFMSTSSGVVISAKKTNDQMGGGSLLDSAEWNYAAFPYSKYVEMSGKVPDAVQPISDVVRDTTLGELRKPKAATGTGFPKKPVVLPASNG